MSFENHADDTQPHSVIADYVPACLCFRGFALVGPFVVMIYQMLKKDFLIFFVIYLIFVIGFSQGKWTVCRIHLASSLIDKLSNRTDSCFFGCAENDVIDELDTVHRPLLSAALVA